MADKPSSLHPTTTKFLGKEMYLVTTRPVRSPEIEKRLKDHLDHQVELEKRGIMFAAGPLYPRGSDIPKAGIDVLHVPFKGLSPLVTELLAGRIDLSIAPLPGLLHKQVESGNIRALALASRKRSEFLPSLPTFAESGLPGVEADAIGALFAPARTPAAVIDRLYRAVAVALTKENVVASAARQSIPIVLRSPAEISATLPAEVEKWASVIKLANIPVE